MWQKYLADTHGNIEALNQIYSTRYSGFDTVPMAKRIEASPQFYDWMIFNETVFGDWHQWLAEIVHLTAPDIPVHAKMMDAPLSPSGYKPSLTWGIDAERFAQFTQLNGNDSYNLLFNSGGGIVSKMRWYDFLLSLKKRPIYNSEDHVIEDRSGNYIPQQAMHVRADIWQGAVHGRTASTIWVWERTHDKNSDFAGSILHRPDVVSAVGKTNLDLNRLAYEVTALQNEPARIAILYSNPAKIYDGTYMENVSKVYENIIFNGLKPGFITEKQLAQGELGSYRIIVVPAAIHVMHGTLSAIKEFIDRGGKTLVIGDNSLSRDFYDRDISNADRSFIMKNSVVLRENSSEIINVIREILRETGLQKVMLMDNAANSPVYGVEWLSVEYNGKLLTNVCNYEWGDSKSVSIFINGRQAGSAFDLITGVVLNGGNIKLAPFTPVLLDIKM
jgi:hypothetical protein